MKNSVLYPPNLQQLGDTVICDFAHGSRHNFIFDEDTRERSTSSTLDIDESRPQYIRLPPSIRAPKRFDSSALFSPAPRRTRLDAPTSQAPLSGDANFDSRATARKERQELTDVRDKSLMLRRARGRIYQGRHRVKMRQSEMELQASIKALQEQTQQLKTDKLIVSLGLAMNTTPWSVAAEYSRLFQHGMVDEEKPIDAASVVCDALVQQHFLRTTMSPDMSDGTMYGLEAVIESWKFMSRCFANIDMVPLRLENGPGDMLVANCKCNLTITEDTLRLAFPHLIQDQVGNKVGSLAADLVGKILVIQGTMHLRWDAAWPALCGRWIWSSLCWNSWVVSKTFLACSTTL